MSDYGGIHATPFPEEALDRGHAHALVKGDGDLVWGKVVSDCLAGTPRRIYEGGRIEGCQFPGRTMGPDAWRQIYVGVGADHVRVGADYSWIPEALLVLQRLANGRGKSLGNADSRT